MKTPRYKTEAALMADYKALLRGLDEIRPKDTTLFESKPQPAPAPIVESVEEQREPVRAESAPLSRYSSPKGAMNSFRVLAGLEEYVMTPRDPGMLGTTRTVRSLEEQYGLLNEDMEQKPAPIVRKRAQGGLGGLGNDNPKIKQDLGGYSAKSAHKALTHSQRVMDNSHAIHSYMHELPGSAQSHMKQQLAQHHKHASYKLRGAADGAPDDIHQKMHAMADKHERYSGIYRNGGRPKLESIEASQELIESIIDIVTA